MEALRGGNRSIRNSEEMMCKISIIVPVYNAEKYLNECIDSIINQTYRNLEIILINDGSSDRSGVICDVYKSLDERIKVVHKRNGGLSSSRNAGLDIATGDYVGFVDSDDYIDLSMFETLIHGIEDYNADIAICNLRTFRDGERRSATKRRGSQRIKRDFVCESREFFCRDALKGSQSVCGKLFSKNLIHSLRFPKGRLSEDGYVLYDILMRAKRISYHKLVGYFYRRGSETSLTGRKFLSQDTDMLLVNVRTYLRIKKVFPSLVEAGLHRAVNSGFVHILEKTSDLSLRELLSFRNEMKKMRRGVKYMLADIAISKDLSIMKKCCVFCFYINPVLLLLINKTGIIKANW